MAKAAGNRIKKPRAVTEVRDVAHAVAQLAVADRPVLIGIDGFSGSGKSSLAARLAGELDDAYIIHIDNFLIKERMGRPNADKEAFDRSRLARQVLNPIKHSQTAYFQKLIWEENALSQPVLVPACRYLIVEGVSSTHPDIADYYDYKIWVAVPMETAKARGLNRDLQNGHQTEAQWAQWIQNDLAYQHKHHPDDVADLIFDNR